MKNTSCNPDQIIELIIVQHEVVGGCTDYEFSSFTYRELSEFERGDSLSVESVESELENTLFLSGEIQRSALTTLFLHLPYVFTLLKAIQSSHKP